MFESVIADNIHSLLPDLEKPAKSFYLAGGTALALQLGHRKAIDLDFFSMDKFDSEDLINLIKPKKIVESRKNTLHCHHQGVRLSFLYYPIPLISPLIYWHHLAVAHAKDILAKKFKTVSQRGAKKDFCDLYALFFERYTIKEGCSFFLQRFNNTGINNYSVLKSLTYFNDADHEPDPIWITDDYSTEWENIKQFFVSNIKLFKKYLLDE